MNFAEPRYLILTLFLVPCLAWFYVWAAGQKRRGLQAFAGTDLLDLLTQSVSRRRQRVKAALLILACGFIGLALTMPRWGEAPEVFRRRGIDILVAVDVSKSMWAEDLKPSRIARARREIHDLIRRVEGHRVGLIAFAGEAFVHCPPTTDMDALGLFIESIDVGLIQRGGTRIGDAIREANKVFRESTALAKALILITDGEDHDTKPVDAAQEARKLGAKIYAIGVGTPEGSMIPITGDKGERVYLKDAHGQFVQARLDETALQQIALETGGAYHRATATGLELDEIYNRIESAEKADLETQKQQRYQHRYQIPLLAAFLLLLVELAMTDRRNIPRPGETRAAPSAFRSAPEKVTQPQQ